MWLPVPWAVEGGAKNPAEAARILAYAATSGNDGVVAVGDCKVTQTPSASAAVQVGTGGVVVPCRSTGYASQSYIGSRPIADDTLPIPANGGASAVSYLIVARVENPWLASEPWPDPTDVTVGPYIRSAYYQVAAAVVASPATARAYLVANNISGTALAGITMPASTSAVLNSMIVDLRTVANPRRLPFLITYNPTSGPTNLTSGSFVDWLVSTGAAWTFDVPTWATQLSVLGIVGGAAVDQSSSSTDGSAYGQLRVRLGGTSTSPTLVTQGTTYDLTAPKNQGKTRFTLITADTLAVSAGLRGTSAQFAVQGMKSSGNKNLYSDGGTSVAIQGTFLEVAV